MACTKACTHPLLTPRFLFLLVFIYSWTTSYFFLYLLIVFLPPLKCKLREEVLVLSAATSLGLEQHLDRVDVCKCLQSESAAVPAALTPSLALPLFLPGRILCPPSSFPNYTSIPPLKPEL